MLSPNYDLAAINASETLITHRIITGPIDPIPVLKSLPNVIVISYAEVALQLDLNRENLLKSISAVNHDAMSFTGEINDKLKYFVVYNQRLPLYLIQRGLARELGHIILGHDGSRPENIRTMEAQVFAYHFLCPRPLVRYIQNSGIRFSTEVLGNATGCFERCLSGMRRTPGVHVPIELNRMLKEQFLDYLDNFIDFQRIISEYDESRDADFGTYMDFYEE